MHYASRGSLAISLIASDESAPSIDRKKSAYIAFLFLFLFCINILISSLFENVS
jgi:hypothetical protein